MSDFTDTELHAMTPAELELVDDAAAYTDPDAGDRRFGPLPYDDVLDASGMPMR